MFGRVLIVVCATILGVGILSAIYGITRPPDFDTTTGDMYFVVGIGMIFLGGLSTTLLGFTAWRHRNSRG